MSSTSEHTPTSTPERPLLQTRGRGRGRRGRSNRGTRGRGGNRAQGVNRDVQTESLVENRKSVMKGRIDRMTEQEVRDLLLDVAMREPSLVFMLPEPASWGHYPASSQVPSWCSCHRCREMPSEKEKICCGQQPAYCVSLLPDFRVFCLDEGVLALGKLQRNDLMALRPETDNNASNRHQAYRNFILWRHGHLGRRVRRVVPSCCVWVIRDKFTDPLGHYTGYTDAADH